MNTPLKRIGIILLVSGVMAGVANLALSYASGQLTGGHAKVSILDGGFAQWKVAGGIVGPAPGGAEAGQ